ncbi:hypothetical protein LZ32DRAFT_46416 [Colletotrichum eremochloae]|nr:hypothetical protein LZ32DRAFT_46416 [Colletotrichum eremochloae]
MNTRVVIAIQCNAPDKSRQANEMKKMRIAGCATTKKKIVQQKARQRECMKIAARVMNEYTCGCVGVRERERARIHTRAVLFFFLPLVLFPQRLVQAGKGTGKQIVGYHTRRGLEVRVSCVSERERHRVKSCRLANAGLMQDGRSLAEKSFSMLFLAATCREAGRHKARKAASAWEEGQDRGYNDRGGRAYWQEGGWVWHGMAWHGMA